MILVDIQLDNEIKTGKNLNVKFVNSYKEYKNFENVIFTANKISFNEIFETNITILEFLGNGSYGKVYKIMINNIVCAIKFSNNERENKVYKRYNSLINSVLSENIVKIYCAGKILDESKKIYYTIMEFGGMTLKNFSISNKITNNNVVKLVNQLNDIVVKSVENKILITDFKLSNLTIDDNLHIRLIDYYIKCSEYNPCFNCKIIKSYSCVEYDIDKKIYENDEYNYTGIYIPYAICLINILCNNTITDCCDKLTKEFKLDNLENKKIVFLLQIACYNYNNNSNSYIKKYKKIYKYKKAMEKTYDFLKDDLFYKYFIDLLKPKDYAKTFFNYKKIALIINGLMNLCPDQRTIKHIMQ